MYIIQNRRTFLAGLTAAGTAGTYRCSFIGAREAAARNDHRPAAAVFR